MRGKYLPKRRLEELDRILSAKDKAILCSLQNCRYLTTGQIWRLHYIDCVNPTAGQRAANWGTAKLRSYGLIEILDRRVGGVRAGSAAYVFTLTESGFYFLNLNNPDFAPRKRTIEPSLNFMKHTLEVSEAYVKLIEICEEQQIKLVKTEMEPECWRPYTNEDGKIASMKPDMYAITVNGRFEDSWFIEVDMGTQSPSVLLDKCRRYLHYFRSGIEQNKNGVFPLVVWIVQNESRLEKLWQYINDCREIPESYKSIFTIILPEQFETLISGGVEALTKGDKTNETN